MTDYKTANILSTADAAYIAGLVDGEGTVTLSRKHRNENRQLAVTISSTERQLLDFVKHRSGVGKITGKRTYRPQHAKSFTYAVYNRQALCLLAQIQPHLRSYKLQRANLVLRDYIAVTPRNGKYSEQLKQLRRRFEADFFQCKPQSKIAATRRPSKEF